MAGKIERTAREIVRFGYEVCANGYYERISTERVLKAIGEQNNIRPNFTENERDILTRDGAVALSLGRETLRELRRDGKPFLHLFDGGERMLDTSTRLTEVAIYPTYPRFLVPDSNWKNFDRQLSKVYEDGVSLRTRLGLPTVAQIMPEAIDLAQIIFHSENKLESLILKNSNREIRTTTPMNTGRDIYVARVSILAGGMLDITSCNVKHGDPNIWTARIIVPRKHPGKIGSSLIL